MFPDPLHPAVVHFPIVLLLLGAPLAVVAVFFRGHHLPSLAAVVLLLGACGAVVATVTGGNDEEVAGELVGNGEGILEEHEEWGERARNLGLIAAVLAMASAALARQPAAGRIVGAIAAVVAIAAALAVAQAGHYGGQVVYKLGVGVNTPASGAGLPPATEQGKGSKPDDD
jgi:uncharacterized membrane protein